MIQTNPYKLTDEYQKIADSAAHSLVTVQSHHAYTTWVVVDDRTQAERLAENNNVDIGFYIKPGETARFELPSGTATAKIIQPDGVGFVAVTTS
jgi:hypothetical protein